MTGTTASRRAWIFGPLLVLLLLLTGCSGGLLADKTSAATTAPTTSASAPTTQSPTPTPSPSDTCDPKFKQVPNDYGPDGRVDGTFEADYVKTVADKKGTDMAQAQRDLLLSHAADNGQHLAVWAHALKLYDDPNNVKPLVNGDCLSTQGQDLYKQLEGALKASSLTQAPAPATGYNSGTVGGKYVVAQNPGIIGDNTSIEVTLPNGTKVSILKHCGNVVFEAPPANVPTSPEIPQPSPPQQPSAPQPPTYYPPTHQPSCYPMWGIYPNCYGAKNPALGTQNQGNNMPGGGGQAPAQQDPVGAPAGGTPPQTYVAPAAPAAPAPTQAPPVQVQQPSGPQPTVAPSTQPPNNGYVNPNPTTGTYCNPDFQNCPTK